MNSETSAKGTDELERMTQIAEEHAFSVRQLIGQRARLFKLLEAVGCVADFKRGDGSLPAVLRDVEKGVSQFYQDVYALLFNNGKRNGFFVEFGACDGIAIDNTFILENEFGWRGILSEPAKGWHKSLRQNRRCIIDHRCVWSKTGHKITFVEFSDDGTQSKVAGEGNAEGRPSETYEVETVSLADLLQQHEAPPHIDFISIDVEGAEFEVLKDFPFGEYSFGFMCVEHHTEEQERSIKTLLEENGYRQILRDVSGHDGFYVKAEVAIAIGLK